jgi:hypothetical protein
MADELRHGHSRHDRRVLVAVLVPYGIFLLLAITQRRRPKEFTIHKGHFVVEASPFFAAGQAMMLMVLSGGLVFSERVPFGDSMRLAEFALPATVVAVGLFWAGALAHLLIARPQLRIDHDGLTIRRVWRFTRIAWDDLAPGGPVPPTRRRARQMRVYLNGPPVFGQYPPSEDIPIGWLHIEDRATIGTSSASAINAYDNERDPKDDRQASYGHHSLREEVHTEKP